MSSGKVKGEDSGISGHHKLERCLRTHWWVLWCSCGDLCFQSSGALCTENNIEVPKKIIRWGRDWEHGKLMLSKNPRHFLHTNSSIKAMWNWSAGLLILDIFSPPVPSLKTLILSLVPFFQTALTTFSPYLLHWPQQVVTGTETSPFQFLHQWPFWCHHGCLQCSISSLLTFWELLLRWRGNAEEFQTKMSRDQNDIKIFWGSLIAK